MNDHETYLLLAARQIGEGLTPSEEAELDQHLATCPSCRSFIAGMRRDDILLRGQLGEVAVAPRVRQRVLDEAYGRRSRFDPRIVLALAATLLLATIGIPLIVGSGGPSASPKAVVSVEPTSPPPTTASPSASSAAPTPAADAYVAAQYTYTDRNSRRDSVAARFDNGVPVGEWTRTIRPEDADGITYGGTVTCLVVDGNDAWLAGPAHTASDDTSDRSAFVYLHEGSSDDQDRAILWMNNRGQTLATLEQWCQTRFIPADPFALDNGDIVVDAGDAEPSPQSSVPSSAPPTPTRTGGFVSAAYVYNEQAPRRDSISARFEDGQVTGEWTRNQPPTGTPRNSFAGPVTCLEIDGKDAWLAGPSTVDTVGDTPAVFIRLHDGGPDGEGDLALLWRANPGQTIETMEGWCGTRFSPESPVPITTGDIVIDDGSASPSP